MTKKSHKLYVHDEDMRKLAKAFFDNLVREERCEFGGIGLDDKRPFGNSSVEEDILEIIGVEMEGDDGEDKCWSSDQREYALNLYANLIPWLKKNCGDKL